MEIRKHPMHIMPAMKLAKTFAETGSFGGDAVTLSSQEFSKNMDSVMKGARLHREAAALSKLDGGPQDLDPAENQVYTQDGKQVENKGNALYMCIPKGDSTTYFVVQTEGDQQRLAFAEQSNLEMGGPPTRFFGVTVNLKTSEATAQSLTWQH
ncbi:hypothetical protein JST97_14080 [bacterium]|nr:hypothetical protein [bacterium]